MGKLTKYKENGQSGYRISYGSIWEARKLCEREIKRLEHLVLNKAQTELYLLKKIDKCRAEIANAYKKLDELKWLTPDTSGIGTVKALLKQVEDGYAEKEKNEKK